MILKGAMKANEFIHGDSVWHKNDKRMEGSVIDIHGPGDPAVEWKGMMPKYIEVFWYHSGECTLHHQSELEKY